MGQSPRGPERKCAGPALQREEREGLNWGFGYLLNKLGTSSQMRAGLLAVCPPHEGTHPRAPSGCCAVSQATATLLFPHCTSPYSVAALKHSKQVVNSQQHQQVVLQSCKALGKLRLQALRQQAFFSEEMATN